MGESHLYEITATGAIVADTGTWDHMGGWGWGMMFFWSMLVLVVVGVAIWAAVAAGRSGHRPSPDRRARAMLDERLASGDIDVDEYRHRKAELES